MKPVFILVCLTLVSCNNNQSTSDNRNTEQSKVQIKLARLKENYAAEYEDAPNNAAQNQVKDKYQDLVNTYLQDSCKGVLKNMSVHVGRVEKIATGMFTGQFTDGSARYRLSQKWPDEETMKSDSIYQLLTRLRESSDTILNFRYAGSCQVNQPKSSKGAFQIDVRLTTK
jgi:hypothetical protein